MVESAIWTQCIPNMQIWYTSIQPKFLLIGYGSDVEYFELGLNSSVG